jgi:hypothetical protein
MLAGIRCTGTGYLCLVKNLGMMQSGQNRDVIGMTLPAAYKRYFRRARPPGWDMENDSTLAVGPITMCAMPACLVRCVQTHGVDDDVEDEDPQLHVLQDLYNAVDTREKLIRTRVKPIPENTEHSDPILIHDRIRWGAKKKLPSWKT